MMSTPTAELSSVDPLRSSLNRCSTLDRALLALGSSINSLSGILNRDRLPVLAQDDDLDLSSLGNEPDVGQPGERTKLEQTWGDFDRSYIRTRYKGFDVPLFEVAELRLPQRETTKSEEYGYLGDESEVHPEDPLHKSNIDTQLELDEYMKSEPTPQVSEQPHGDVAQHQETTSSVATSPVPPPPKLQFPNCDTPTPSWPLDCDTPTPSPPLPQIYVFDTPTPSPPLPQISVFSTPTPSPPLPQISIFNTPTPSPPMPQPPDFDTPTPSRPQPQISVFDTPTPSPQLLQISDCKTPTPSLPQSPVMTNRGRTKTSLKAPSSLANNTGRDPAYRRKRERNNQAVKEWRARQRERDQKKEQLVPKLQAKNKVLKQKVADMERDIENMRSNLSEVDLQRLCTTAV